jgi:hypothetical protein
VDQEVALFRVLERALIEALEEAKDVGYLDGWDRADGDVPSVASHPQNAAQAARAVPSREQRASRVILCGSLAYLDSIDHSWASAQLVPYLAWDQPQAATMWGSRAFDRLGSAQLFNSLKTDMLEAFEKPAMSDHDLEGLMVHLLTHSLRAQATRGERVHFVGCRN